MLQQSATGVSQRCRTVKKEEKKCDTVGDNEKLERHHTDPTDTE